MSYSDEQRKIILQYANDSIQHGFKFNRPPFIDITPAPRELQQIRACFVTLTIENELRGCIGSLQATRPLLIDINENAFSAAFKDPRFFPLQLNDYSDIKIHVSILNPAEPIMVNSEVELLALLRPNVDGLILQEGALRATFLPTVWESLTAPKEFVQQLKLKAGLPVNYWSPNMRVFRYTTVDIE